MQPPIWKKNVNVSGFAERNRLAIEDENRRLREDESRRLREDDASQPMGVPRMKSGIGTVKFDIGGGVWDELDAEELADDPAYSKVAHEALWKRDMQSARDEAEAMGLELSNPSRRRLSKAERDEMLAIDSQLEENDPKHIELKSKLVADDEMTAMEQKQWDAKKRSQELGRMGPKGYEEYRKQQKLQSVVKDSQVIAQEESVIKAKDAEGVSGKELQAHQEAKQAILAQKQDIQQQAGNIVSPKPSSVTSELQAAEKPKTIDDYDKELQSHEAEIAAFEKSGGDPKRVVDYKKQVTAQRAILERSKVQAKEAELRASAIEIIGLNSGTKAIAEKSDTAYQSFKDFFNDLLGSDEVRADNRISGLVGSVGIDAAIEDYERKMRQEFLTGGTGADMGGSAYMLAKEKYVARAAIPKLKALKDKLGPEADRILKDAAKEYAWTEADDDNVRTLSDGELRINPGRVFGDLPKLRADIADQSGDDSVKKNAMARLEAMRSAMADEMVAKFTKVDSSFKEFVSKWQGGDKAAMIDEWSKQQSDRNFVYKVGDVLQIGIHTGARGLMGTVYDVSAGGAAAVGANETAGAIGKASMALSKKTADINAAGKLRGLTGGYGVGVDVTNTVVQMGPMFVGGAYASVAKSALRATIARGAAVYGTSFLQGAGSKYQDALMLEEQKLRRELSEAEVADVLGRKETQIAAFANGANSALVNMLMTGGAESIVAGAAGKLTILDFLRKGGRQALKDSGLRTELKQIANTMFRHSRAEAVEEGVNQMLDEIISYAALGKDFALGDALERTFHGAMMGAFVGGPISQARFSKRAQAAAAMVARGQAAPTPEELRKVDEVAGPDVDVDQQVQYATAQREIDAAEPEAKLRATATLKLARGASMDELTANEVTSLGVNRHGARLWPDTPALVEIVNGRPIILDAAIQELESIAPSAKGLVTMTEGEARTKFSKQRFTVTSKSGAVIQVDAKDAAEAEKIGAKQFDLGDGVETVTLAATGGAKKAKPVADQTAIDTAATTDPNFKGRESEVMPTLILDTTQEQTELGGKVRSRLGERVKFTNQPEYRLSANEQEIVMNLNRLEREAASLGLNKQQTEQWIQAAIDEELFHYSHLQVARDEYAKSGDTRPFKQWRDETYAKKWEDDYVKTGRYKVIAELYPGLGEIAPWARYFEALRMEWQQIVKGSPTEQAQLSVKSNASIIEELLAMLKKLKAMVQSLTPSMRREIALVQAYLKKIGSDLGSKSLPDDLAEKLARPDWNVIAWTNDEIKQMNDALGESSPFYEPNNKGSAKNQGSAQAPVQVQSVPTGAAAKPSATPRVSAGANAAPATPQAKTAFEVGQQVTGKVTSENDAAHGKTMSGTVFKVGEGFILVTVPSQKSPVRMAVGDVKIADESVNPPAEKESAKETHTFYTPNPDAKVRAYGTVKIVSASELERMILTDVSENQARLRNDQNANSVEQVAKIAANPKPHLLLGIDSSVSEGAPTVHDGAVLAGNGRSMGVAAAYKAGRADSYRQAVIAKAKEMGIAFDESIPDPVMIRYVTRFENGTAQDFADQSNSQGMLDLTSVELAEIDAQVLGDFNSIETTTTGEFTAAAIRDVAAAFDRDGRKKVDRETNGQPSSKQVASRIRNAALAKLFSKAGKPLNELLGVMESEEGIRIVSIIAAHASRLIKMDQDLSLSVDLTDALIELQSGLRGVAQGKYLTLNEWQDNRGAELIGRTNITDAGLWLTDKMVSAQKKPSVLKDFFVSYLSLAENEQKHRNEANQSNDIFGEQRRAQSSFAQLIAIANRGQQSEREASTIENQAKTATDAEIDSLIAEVDTQLRDLETIGLDDRDHSGAVKSNVLSKMDVAQTNAKELFPDDGGFALSQQSTQDGDKAAKEKADVEAAKEAADKAQGKLFDGDKPTLTEAEKATEKAFEGLFAASLAPSYTENIPSDRLGGMINAAAKLIADGVRTPQAMAAALSRIEQANGKPGALRKYSEAFWSAFRMVDTTLPKDVDWAKAYEPKKEQSPDKKQDEEEREIAMVMEARSIVQSPNYTMAQKYAEMVRIYDETPAFTAKTSTSKINQAYSTPMPMAYAASIMGKVTTRKRLADSAGGHAGLLIEAPATADVMVNELDPKRVARLRRSFPDWTITNEDATTLEIDGKVDGMQLNPPFGTVLLEDGSKKQFQTPFGETDQIDHAIVAHNLDNNLERDGRAVLLIGGPPPLIKSEDGRREYYGKGKRAKFFQWLNDNYNVIDHLTIDGTLYKKQGAGWPIDMIVIDGKGKSKTALPSAKAPDMLSTWSELFDRSQLSDNERIANRQITEQQMRDTVRDLSTGLEGLAVGGASATDTRPPAIPRSEQTGDEGANRGVRSVSDDRAQNRPSADDGANQGGNTENRGDSGTSGRSDIQAGSNAGRDGKSAVKVTSFQSTYTPTAEGVASLDTLIPSNMADPVQQALAKIQKEVGPLTAFVRRELGYRADEDISKHYAGEQIDALAAAIYNFERGGALIVGDQTGIGKGRIAAGLMRYAVNKGLIPIFVTEKAGLLDLMMRVDLPDVGAGSIVKPSVMLADLAKWPHARTAKLPFGKAYFELAAQQGQLSEGANAIFTLYSQIQADTDKSVTKEQRASSKRNQTAPLSGWRSAALKAFGNRAVYILDESHNASGMSTTGFRMAELLKTSSRVYYSSATSAKRPENFAIYFKTNIGRITNGDMQKLTDLMQSGGVPAMQLASYMLAKDGQYLRRERSFDGITFATRIVTESAKRDAALSDNLTYALRKVVMVQNAMSQVADMINDKISKIGSKDKIPSGNRDKLETMNFASKTHNVVSQYLLAIKVASTVKESIKALSQGKKVVVGLSNTMESAIKDLAGRDEADFTMDYKGLVMRYLDSMRTMKAGGNEFQVTAVGNPKYDSVKTEQLFNMALTKGSNAAGEKIVTINQEVVAEITRRYMWNIYEQALNEVRTVDLGDLPLSPIDALRQAVEQAGYRTGEITGRGLGVDVNGELYERSGREIDEGKINDRDAFNDEDLDFLVINQSGSTGINLHCSEKALNKKPRMMIVVQPSLDINIFMQMLGRIHRSGQVKLPEFMLLQTSLPAEYRPAAILMVKMSMLNANTTSNSKSEISEGNKAVDIFNKYGDLIAYNALERDPDLIRQLMPFEGLFKKIEGSNGGIVSFQEAQGIVGGQPDGYIARTITGYSAILPVEEQNMFWEKVLDGYLSMIDYLNEIGQNDLIAKDLDLKAKTVESKLFTQPGDGDSMFDEASTIETVETAIGKKPITGDEAVAISKTAKQSSREIAQKYQESATKLIDERIAESKAKAIKWTDEKETKMRGDMIESRNTITRAILMLGDMGSVPREDGSFGMGVIESVKLDEERPFAPGQQLFTVMVNDGRNKVRFSAAKLTEAFKAGLPSASEWDSTTFVGSTRHIVTGNLLAALKQLDGKGQVISYTTDSGETKMGLMLPAMLTKTLEAEKSRTRAVKTASEILEAFDRNASVMNADKTVVLMNGDVEGSGNLTLLVPSSQKAGGKYWRNTALNAQMLGGEFRELSGRMSGTFKRENLQKVIDLLGVDLLAIDRAKNDAEALYAAPLSGRDADYMDAVEAGDMETAQKMVDEAAKQAIVRKMINPVNVKFKETDQERGRVDKLKELYGSDASNIEWDDQAAIIATIDADGDLTLQDGHHRATAWRERKFKAVPVIVVPEEVWQHLENQRGFSSAGMSVAESIGDFITSGQASFQGAKSQYENFADPVTYDDQGNVIPLSQRFNPTNDSILHAGNLSGRARSEINEGAVRETMTQQREFGNVVRPPNRASIGNEATRRVVDAFDIDFEERREKESREEWVKKGTKKAATDRKDLIENALLNAYGEVGAVPMMPEDMIGTQIVIEQMVQEAGNNFDKLIEAGTIIQAYRKVRGDIARVLASGWDRLMPPDERNRRYLANAILTLPPTIARDISKRGYSPEKTRELIQEELRNRLNKIEKALKEYGVTINEVLGKQVYLSLNKKNIIKDIMAKNTKDEQLAIRMHQQATDVQKIAKATHMTVTEVQALIDKVYNESLELMKVKARGGATLESLQAAALSEAEVEAEARRMVEIGLGISPTAHTSATRMMKKKGKKAKAEMTDAEIAEAETEVTEKIAKRWVNKLAESQSDTLSWSAKALANIHALEALIREHVKTGVKDFRQKAEDLGATPQQSFVIDKEAIEERRRKELIKTTRRTQAEEKVEAARAARNTPEAIAKRWIDKYAKSQSDTQAWGKGGKKADDVSKLIKEHLKNNLPDFIQRAVALGVTAEQARVLNGEVNQERSILAQIKESRKMVINKPEKVNWARPEFTSGLLDYEFDTKDLAAIKQTVQALINATAAKAKVESITDPEKRAKADAMLAKLETILAKYGTNISSVVESGKPLESYRFDITDRVHVHIVANAIRSVDSDWIDKGVEYAYFSMLSGIQTFAKNLSSVPWSMFEATIQRGSEAILNIFFNNPMNATFKEVEYMVRAMGPMLERAKSNFIASYGAEVPFFEQDILGVPPDLEKVLEGHGMYHRTAISGQKGRYLRIPTRALMATDDYVKTVNAMIEVGAMAYRLCKAAGLNEGTPEFNEKLKELVNIPGSLAWQLAAKKAYQRTFTEALPGETDPVTGKPRPVRTIGETIGRGVHLLSQLANLKVETKMAKLAVALFRLSFLPFIKVPYNITATAIGYTPVSMIDIATLTAHYLLDKRKGKGLSDPKDIQQYEMELMMKKGEVIEKMSKMMLGNMLTALLIGAGWGEGDDDDLEKTLLFTGSRPHAETSKGVRETSERLGVGAYTISWKKPNGTRGKFYYGGIEPVATILATSIDTINQVKQAARGQQSYNDAIGGIAYSFTNQLADKSFLRGFGDLYKFLQGQTDMSQYAADKIGMLMPNLIKQVVRESDPLYREKADSFTEAVTYALMPIGQKNAKVDNYGEEVKKTGSILTRWIDFTETGSVPVKEVDEMLWRYHLKNPNASIPSSASPTYSVNGKQQKMTENQAAMYRKQAGKIFTARVPRLTLNYKNPTDSDIKAVIKLVDESRDIAKKILIHKPDWK